MSVASGRAGQGPGGPRPPGGGAAAVLEVIGRVPDDLAAGNGSRGPCGAYSVVQVRPMVRSAVRAVPLAAVIPSRAAGPGGRGRMGRGPRQKRRSGGVNQGGARAAG